MFLETLVKVINCVLQVDAQNKFMGKSFEIRPTGIAHAELFLPEKLGPDYPKAKGHVRSDRVVEHYSWKKVTTNVSGFILGSPTIDHYGEMTVSLIFCPGTPELTLRRSQTIAPATNVY